MRAVANSDGIAKETAQLVRSVKAVAISRAVLILPQIDGGKLRKRVKARADATIARMSKSRPIISHTSQPGARPASVRER